MTDDLTTPSYWGERQQHVALPRDTEAIKDLLDAVEPFVRDFERERWLELGCSPGHFSSLLHRRVPFEPFGVDFSPQANLYLDSMRILAGVDATLVRSDVREFTADRPDLRRHNVDMMTLATFRSFAERMNLETLFLNHVGGMYFWNVDTSGPKPIAFMRKALSLAVRGVTNKIISRFLPRGVRLYAPWILFIARRP